MGDVGQVLKSAPENLWSVVTVTFSRQESAKLGCLPVDQSCDTLGRTGGHQGLLQPLVERCGRFPRCCPEFAKVVIAQATANYQQTFIAQRSQSEPDGEVLLGVVAMPHGQLQHRNISVRVDHCQWGERAMVKPTQRSRRTAKPASLMSLHTRSAVRGEPGAG